MQWLEENADALSYRLDQQDTLVAGSIMCQVNVTQNQATLWCFLVAREDLARIAMTKKKGGDASPPASLCHAFAPPLLCDRYTSPHSWEDHPNPAKHLAAISGALKLSKVNRGALWAVGA